MVHPLDRVRIIGVLLMHAAGPASRQPRGDAEQRRLSEHRQERPFNIVRSEQEPITRLFRVPKEHCKGSYR